jgi:hypothetical protein
MNGASGEQRDATGDAPTLNYRSGADDQVIKRQVADGCVYQVCATLVTLACMVSFFAFAWLAVALLLLAMYPQEQWTAAERAWVGATSLLTTLAAVVCFMGALRALPWRWGKQP